MKEIVKVKKYHPRLRVMEFLLEQKVATKDQIHQYCFSENSIRYARKTIQELSSLGLVKTIQTISFMDRLQLVHQLTQKGFEEFKTLSDLDLDKVQIKSNYRSHDLHLTSIRNQLSRCLESKTFLTENVIQSQLFDTIAPDIASFRNNRCDAGIELEINGKNIWLAVEFERIQKVRARIEEKLKRWYQSEELKGVLFIAASERLKQFVSDIDREIYKNLNRKVYFSSFAPFLEKSESISFASSTGRIIELKSDRSKSTFFPFLEQNISSS